MMTLVRGPCHYRDHCLDDWSWEDCHTIALDSFSLGRWCPQLKFERHPLVHKLFLNNWDKGNQSRKGWPLEVSVNLVSKTKSNLLLLYPVKSTHPTLVFVCTHDSLSNLSCVSGVIFRPGMLISGQYQGHATQVMGSANILVSRLRQGS